MGDGRWTNMPISHTVAVSSCITGTHADAHMRTHGTHAQPEHTQTHTRALTTSPHPGTQQLYLEEIEAKTGGGEEGGGGGDRSRRFSIFHAN